MLNLLKKYPSQTQTIRNNEPMPYYDAFLVWAKQIQIYFESAKDYAGYPMLPEIWIDGYELYKKASQPEKDFIANHSMNLFTECFRHWKTDKDLLYPNSNNTPFYL